MADEVKNLQGAAALSRENTRINYNRLSRWYDLLSGKSEQAVSQFGLQMLKLKPGETVLEVGFGTGHNLLALAELVGTTGHVHGIDLSEGMLAVAQARLLKAGLAGKVDLHCGDASRLPYGAEMFDAAFCSFTLELFDAAEIPLVLQEIQRVLRRSGRLGIVSLSGYGKTNVMTRLYNLAHRKLPAIVDCRPILVQKALLEAGFEVPRVDIRSIWGLAVEVVVGVKRQQDFIPEDHTEF
jgi:ubiquinone/menaquinone biosynthesis C-methylase UbiE